MYLAWEADPRDAGWQCLCLCANPQQSHQCMLYLHTLFPCLQDGDGAGCMHACLKTVAAFRIFANNSNDPGMTGLHAENMQQ